MFDAIPPSIFIPLFIGGITALSLITATLSLFSSTILFVCSAIGLLPLLSYCRSWIPTPGSLRESLHLNGSVANAISIWYPNTILQNHYFVPHTISVIPAFPPLLRSLCDWLGLVPNTVEDLKRVLNQQGSVATSVPTEEIWRSALATGTPIVPVLSTPLTFRELVGLVWAPLAPRTSRAGTPIPVSRIEQVTDADIVALRSKYEAGLQILLESTRENGQNTESQQTNQS